MDTGIGVDQDALGGEALGTVTGDGVSVVEMAMFFWIELNQAIVVEAGRNTAIGRDGFNGRRCG